MKVAIPVWNGCVSSAFDFAHRLLVVDIENSKVIESSEVELSAESLPQRAANLKKIGVDVLVCGAISRALAGMVTACGIEVLAFVTGQVDDVLQAYLTGQLVKPQFTMPGCWLGARKDFRRWRRGRRRRGGRP